MEDTFSSLYPNLNQAQSSYFFDALELNEPLLVMVMLTAKIGQDQFKFKKNQVELANFESKRNCPRAANRPSVFSSHHRVSFSHFQKEQHSRTVFVFLTPHLNMRQNHDLSHHHFHRDLNFNY